MKEYNQEKMREAWIEMLKKPGFKLLILMNADEDLYKNLHNITFGDFQFESHIVNDDAYEDIKIYSSYIMFEDKNWSLGPIRVVRPYNDKREKFILNGYIVWDLHNSHFTKTYNEAEFTYRLLESFYKECFRTNLFDFPLSSEKSEEKE